MEFLKSIFGSRRTETPIVPDTALTGWYCVDSPDRTVRQVVMSFPPDTVAETKFGLIILPADKYPILAMNSWCAGFCTINQQSVAMLRAGDFASAVKAAGVTLAISFCKMPSHSILIISIRVESQKLTGPVRKKYPQVPPLTHPVAEWISGLNPYDRELIPAVFGSDCFRLVLAEDSSSTNCVFLPNGERQESAMPGVVCEFHKHLSDDLKHALEERWKALLAHDAAIPKSRRDFQKAIGNEVLKLLPVDKDPILPRRG